MFILNCEAISVTSMYGFYFNLPRSLRNFGLYKTRFWENKGKSF